MGFKLYDVINTKEQTIINSIKDRFEGENIQTRYSALGYTIDLYFHEYKFATEVDKLGHVDRQIKYLEKNLIVLFVDLINQGF